MKEPFKGKTSNTGTNGRLEEHLEVGKSPTGQDYHYITTWGFDRVWEWQRRKGISHKRPNNHSVNIWGTLPETKSLRCVGGSPRLEEASEPSHQRNVMTYTDANGIRQNAPRITRQAYIRCKELKKGQTAPDRRYGKHCTVFLSAWKTQKLTILYLLISICFLIVLKNNL